MTFTEIQTAITSDLNLTSTAATTRIGNKINMYYRMVTSSIGLSLTRSSMGVTSASAANVQTLTFSNLQRLDRVYYDGSGTVVVLEPVPLETIRELTPGTQFPTQYAIELMGSSSVTIRFNSKPQGIYTFKADGMATTSTLSGSQVPAFSADFHDVLILLVEADERRKDEKAASVRLDQLAQRRLSELKLFIATNVVREALQQ